jgi:ribonucleotide reductase alpha subunit
MAIPQQLPTDYQNYIAKSRYARFLDKEGRRENWDETVSRYFDYFQQDMEESHGYKLSPVLRSELEDAVGNLHVMPSMRALMTAGEAARRENMATYNCSYIPIDRPKALAEVLYILLCGTGVGFSVERQVIKQLPDVPAQFAKVGREIVVADSKRGWAQAYLELVECLYAGVVPKVNVSLVRPAGARLMTFGGRASGPEPLLKLCEFTVRTFRNAAGRKLNSLEVHELCTKVGESVVVGGVRRSAEISLSNLSDLRMRDAKSGNWRETKPHLELANNSVAYTEKPEVGSFMEEWLALYKSKSGERGIFNRYGAIEKIQRLGRRDHRFEFGTNPCVTGDTMLLTSRGWHPIESLAGQDVEVWNGKAWSSVPVFSTGLNDVYTVTLSDGSVIRATGAHGWAVTPTSRKTRKGVYEHPNPVGGYTYLKRVSTAELRPGMTLSKFSPPEVVSYGEDPAVDAYSQGFYSGDGTTGGKVSWVYASKYAVVGALQGEIKPEREGYTRRDWKHGPMLDKCFVPLNATVRYKLNWLAGLLDSDGSVCNPPAPKGYSGLQITSVQLEFLRDVKRMLFSLGCHSHLEVTAEGSWGYIGEDTGKRVWFKPCHRLVISQVDTQKLVTLGLATERLVIEQGPDILDPRRKRYVSVVSVELTGEEETFCVTEPEFGLCTFDTITTFQCGEIILRPRGLCNLTEAIVRERDGKGDLREKVRLASILGTWQSTQTRFRFVDPEWTLNAEQERLLGVSLTGIYDNPLMRGDHGLVQLGLDLQDLKSTVIKANRIEAIEVGINPSTACTTVKPSGTVSQLVLSPSGIHQGHAPHYIRRVTGDRKDPITAFMADAGIPHEPHHSKPEEMMVFSFPVALGASTLTREQVTAIQHLELVKCYNLNWSEHAVSCTISVKENEWPSVGGWVYDNFDMLAGVSFLPHFAEDSSYVQLPYQTITQGEYCQMRAGMPDSIKWDDLRHYEAGQDTVTGTREFACVGNMCEVVEATQAV